MRSPFDSGAVEAGCSIKKNRQLLANSGGIWYCFSEIPMSQVRTSHERHATKASALEQIEFGSTWPIIAAGDSKCGGAVHRASGRTPVLRGAMDRVCKPISMELQSALGQGRDSEMAPQAIEISQNGLGDPQLAVVPKESFDKANSVSRAAIIAKRSLRNVPPRWCVRNNVKAESPVVWAVSLAAGG